MLRTYIPNALTIARVILIPFILTSFYYVTPGTINWLGFGLFIIAAVTDFLDGYLARRWKVESNFGATLDPIADKVLVSTLLIMLVRHNETDALMVCIIIAREFIVSSLRELKSGLLVVSKLGKIKTATQMLAVFFLLLATKSDSLIFSLGNLCLYCAAILSVITCVDYIRIYLRDLR